VAKETGVKVADQKLFVDGLGEPGSQGDTYIGMLTNNTCTIVEGLGGKCTPFVNKKN
jgi:manganese/iron transport system substrate-binding protein